MDDISLYSKEMDLIESEKKWIKSVLERYDVSYTCGFLARADQIPLPKFGNPYFSIWDKIFKDLATLIGSKQLQQSVEQMPLLDYNNLVNEGEWGRAFTVLSVITQGYVWQNGEHNPAKVIPKCLAVPFVAVAEHIGCCPVASLWPTILNNWKIKDKARPLDLRNVEEMSSFTGSEDERWFFLIHWQIEMDSTPGIKSVVAAQKAILDENPKLLRACLITIQETIQKLEATLKRMFEHCDPAVFYTKIRVFEHGWKNNESLPDGILYEGVSSKPLKFYGASAAQSTTFHVFDAAFGIVHFSKGGKKSYLESMLDYMPRGHREFVLHTRKGPSIRSYVERSKNDELKKLYNDCVQSLEQFRSFHIQLVTRYVTIQAAKVKKFKNPVNGTGGTEYVSFLKRVRDETSEMKI